MSRSLPLLGPVLALTLAATSSAQTPTPTPTSAISGLSVDQSGNVGIGTSAPSAKLDVAGDALVEGTVTGTGNGGQWGAAAVLAGFDAQYGTRKFLFRFQPGATPQQQIAIQAIDPLNPGQSVFKTFIIDHPTDPDRYLVHASLEGPEGAVYYRGSSRLRAGRAVVSLPRYFEALVRREGRTVQLTNVDGFDRIMVERRGGATVLDGTFVVRASNPRSRQRFDWEVKAVRGDGPPLQIEPSKSDISVGGFGPYTYQTGAEPTSLPGRRR